MLCMIIETCVSKKDCYHFISQWAVLHSILKLLDNIGKEVKVRPGPAAAAYFPIKIISRLFHKLISMSVGKTRH